MDNDLQSHHLFDRLKRRRMIICFVSSFVNQLAAEKGLNFPKSATVVKKKRRMGASLSDTIGEAVTELHMVHVQWGSGRNECMSCV